MIRPLERGASLPLSYFQERLWFVHEHMPDQRNSYNVTMSLRIEGEAFSIESLRAAFAALLQRHESLRTCFRVPDGGGSPQQVIVEPWTPRIDVVDVEEARVRESANEFARQGFDLTCGPLLKAMLLRTSPARHTLICNMHHIISDGWSLGVMIRDLQQLYESHRRGVASPLRPLAVQYADYAVWQRHQDLSEHLAYWESELAGFRDGLELPYDRPRGADRQWRAATFQYRYPQGLAQRLSAFSRERHCTLFMSLLAMLAVVLHRYSAREDLCIGTTVAGREQVELEELIGFFVNILPLRLTLSDNPSLEQLLQMTRQVVLRGFEHQGLPFEHLLSTLRRQRDRSQVPLVPVIARHQSFPFIPLETWSQGVSITGFELLGERTTPNELDWQFFGDGSNLELVVEYAADLFDEATVRGMVEHHQQVLERLIEGPWQPVEAVPLLTIRERTLLLQLNATGKSLGPESTLVECFERQVQRQPGAAAFVGAVSLNYQALNEQANALAWQLRALGAGAETRVAVICERSPVLLAALLAIFKTGACYVPVDAAYPCAYMERILNDARPQLVFASRGLSLPRVQVHVWLEETSPGAASGKGNPPSARTPLTQLACIMYTSGSTAVPKGVMVPYGQIENWLQASWERWPVQAGEVMLQKTSIAFAVSVKELLSGLLAGAAQLVLGDAQVKDAAALAAAVRHWRVTRIHLVPSHLKALLESGHAAALDSLKIIVTAGEALPRDVAEQTRRLLPRAALWNNYGCTELNDVTYHCGEGRHGVTFVPIGRPIANTQVYVLDERLRQVPVGVIGELHVRSIGMARGYWGQPGLTAQRFLADPFGAPGSRLYRTGDMVRLLKDGQLEYWGRRDHEVKIRGHRIDLRQVSKVIASHPQVRESAVVGWPQGSSTRQLLAYVVARNGQSLRMEDLLRSVSSSLPAYMVPTLLQQLRELPRLPNGKIDTLSLPAPEIADSTVEYIAPRTLTEQRLADMWSEVFRQGGVEVARVGARDNFFNLGGHSLLAAQLFARIRQQFGIELPIGTLFESPVLGNLANAVDLALTATGSPVSVSIPRVPRGEPLPLSYMQKRLWFVHEHMTEQRTSYNGTIGLDIRGDLNVEVLRATLNALIARHETLRTTFRVPDGGAEPMAYIAGSLLIDVPVIPAAESQIIPYMDQLAAHIYDLEHGPLFTAKILRLDARHHVLLIGIHHIVYDAWSLLNVMSRDLQAIYVARLEGYQPVLPSLAIQYADYAAWQRQQDVSGHLDYWKQQLAGFQEGLTLPYDYPRPHDRSWQAATISLRYPDDLAQSFARFNQQHQATLFMGLVASFAIVLSRYTGREDICIGTTTGARGRLELEDLIGFFVNILALRVDLSGNPDVREVMRRSRRTVLEALQHQALPFEHVLNALQKQRDSSQIPLVPVIVRHQNFPNATTHRWRNGLEMEVIARDERTTPAEIDLQFFGDGSYLEVRVEYATALFRESTMRRLLAHHQNVLELMVAGLVEVHETAA